MLFLASWRGFYVDRWLSGKARGMLELAGVPDEYTAVGYDYDLELMVDQGKPDHARTGGTGWPMTAGLAITFWHRGSGAARLGLVTFATRLCSTTRITWWYDRRRSCRGWHGIPCPRRAAGGLLVPMGVRRDRLIRCWMDRVV